MRLTGTRVCTAALLAALIAMIGSPGAAMAAPPDWTGVWVVAGSPMDLQDGVSTGIGRTREGQGGVLRPPLPKPELKGAYKARAEARQASVRRAAAEGAALPFQADDGCRPGPLDTGFWGGPYAFEIVASPREIVIFQEFLEQVRRVYLDGRPHPDLNDYNFTFKGHSTGKWNGGVLTVDTVGIRVDDDSYSDKLRVTERIWSPRPDSLQVAITTTDPEALAAPWTGTYALHRKPALEIQDFYCAENNRNPTDADGRTRTILGK